MRYTYDNSAANPRNPNRPPKRVTFGQTSASEMGSLWIQVLPRSAADLADRSISDFSPKILADDIAGDEKWLEMNPARRTAARRAGACYFEAGPEADSKHLSEAARLDPDAARHTIVGRSAC